ncbi:DUF4316 domain-containing protein [Pseudoflavonifractor phocaeensis]|nr:DUF4316 domain-containing protein [Pseudoflavonifractor phocaeensis]
MKFYFHRKENTMPKKDYPSREQRMKDLTRQLEQGIREVFDSGKYTAYLAAMSRFHRYSARNVLLIQMQLPNATRVASAKKWREEFGRNINRGEKAIYIIAPAPIVRKVERQKIDPDTKAPMLDENGHVIMEEKEFQVPLFRPVPVFDVSQTNGKPLPQLAEDLSGDVRQYEAFLEALRRTAPVPITFEPMAANMDGYFSLDGQRIAIREGMSQVQTVSAAVHEIAHAVLHGEKDGKTRAAEELEAESVSYVVCQYYGIETGANSFGYLASWSKDKELSELRACLDTISKTANGLIAGIDRNFAEVCKEKGIEFSQEENSPHDAANLEAPDTPEKFAADFLDYVAELEAAALLERPYTLDPREQAAADITEELRAGHFASIRDTLDHVGEQAGLPSAVVLLDRLEKLSDERDKSLSFRLEANPHATSYRDQGYLQAAEWTGEGYIPREVVYVGPTDRCRELLYQLEAGELTARQVRELDQTDSKELEALYLLDDATYLHIQLRDEGYDYTLYDKGTLRQLDGGVIDLEDVALSPIKHPLAAVREEIFDAMGDRPEKVEAAPLELVEKLQEAQIELPDTVLDTYPMPDPNCTMEDLAEAGYVEGDLLPVSLDTAELMYGGDFTVYLIRPGEDPELAFDETDLDHHDGLFAILREEWEASPDFDAAIQARLGEEKQEKREAAFLEHQGDCFAIYQLHRGPELRDVRYIPLEQLRAEGESPRKGNYDLVYTAPLAAQGDTLQQLNQLWHQFNENRPADYHSPSMGISDIVALKQGGVVSCHYVDQYAFSELPGFFSGKNPLRAVEDSVEQNDNQLDGILNNAPSVAEPEQPEKKTSVVERLKQPPQPGHKKTAPDKGAERER